MQRTLYNGYPPQRGEVARGRTKNERREKALARIYT